MCLIFRRRAASSRNSRSAVVRRRGRQGGESFVEVFTDPSGHLSSYDCWSEVVSSAYLRKDSVRRREGGIDILLYCKNWSDSPLFWIPFLGHLSYIDDPHPRPAIFIMYVWICFLSHLKCNLASQHLQFSGNSLAKELSHWGTDQCCRVIMRQILPKWFCR